MANNLYNPFLFTLAQNEVASVYTFSNFIKILDATYGSGDDIQVAINEENFGYCFKGWGISTKDQDITKIRIKNINANSNVIRLATSFSEVTDDRTSLDANVTANVTNTDAPETLDSITHVTVPTATATLLLAANASTKEVFISNPESAGGAELLIGDSGVSATNGLPIQPKGALILNTRDAIYAYQASGGNISVPVMSTQGT